MSKQREFVKLLLASFISQTGSHFLTIALSGYIFVTSQSIVKASLVFVLSYFPSILVSGILGNWIDKSISRWLLARNELLSIITSAVCGLALFYRWPLVILCCALALRSLLLFVARTGGIKWVKVITTPEKQTLRIKCFYLSFFLSTAVAGILAASVLSSSGIMAVVIIDIATYLVSFLVDLSLEEIPQHEITSPPNVSVISTLREIFQTDQIRNHFIGVCLSQAVFQGAYSVLVSFLPLHVFQKGLAAVGPFQFAASLGITLGFVVVSLWAGIFSGHEGKGPFKVMLAIGTGSLLCIATVPVLPTSLFMFFSMNFAYECIWLFNNAEFFKKSPQESLGRFQFTLTATASFLMAVATLIYSSLIENYGLESAIYSTLTVGLLAWFISARGTKATAVRMGGVR